MSGAKAKSTIVDRAFVCEHNAKLVHEYFFARSVALQVLGVYTFAQLGFDKQMAENRKLYCESAQLSQAHVALGKPGGEGIAGYYGMSVYQLIDSLLEGGETFLGYDDLLL
jgi:hypothetical protein